jgi:HD-GYP domain-containing protein (c-di-GMP phosphodiesterase class II)
MKMRPGERRHQAGQVAARWVNRVADMHEALTAKRPYRQDLSQEQAMDILTKNARPGIWSLVFSALKRYLANGGYVSEAIAA